MKYDYVCLKQTNNREHMTHFVTKEECIAMLKNKEIQKHTEQTDS